MEPREYTVSQDDAFDIIRRAMAHGALWRAVPSDNGDVGMITVMVQWV